MAAYDPSGQPCPKCGTTGRLAPHGSYTRYLVTHDDGVVTTSLLEVKRFKCPSCRATHALLPDVLIPYGTYSLRFKLTVLLAYFERSMTVGAICSHFAIAISSLYTWLKQFGEHKELLLGVLLSLSTPAVEFIVDWLPKAVDPLRRFIAMFGFSFLQNNRKTTQYAPP